MRRPATDPAPTSQPSPTSVPQARPARQIGTTSALTGQTSALTGAISDFQVERTATETASRSPPTRCSPSTGGADPRRRRRTWRAPRNWSRQGGEGTVRVTGYTDAKGEDAYNLDLSRRRAEAVVAWLRARPRLADAPSTRSAGARRSRSPPTPALTAPTIHRAARATAASWWRSHAPEPLERHAWPTKSATTDAEAGIRCWMSTARPPSPPISARAARSSSPTRWSRRAMEGRGVGSRLVRGALDAGARPGAQGRPAMPVRRGPTSTAIPRTATCL